MITHEQAFDLCRSDPEAAARLMSDQAGKIETLQRLVSDLERKVAQLSKNSTTSSKPPSSDITRRVQ